MTFFDGVDLGETKKLMVMYDLCLVGPELAEVGRDIAKNVPIQEGNALKMLD